MRGESLRQARGGTEPKQHKSLNRSKEGRPRPTRAASSRTRVVRSTCFVLVHPQGREDTRIALCASRSGLEGCPSSGAARGREDNRASRSAGRDARRWGPRARPLPRSVLGESDMRRDLEPDLLLSRRRRPMHRRCGAIFRPRLLRPHVGCLRRHFGSRKSGSSGPWLAGHGSWQQCELMASWQQCELMAIWQQCEAAGHGPSEHSSCENGEQRQLALAVLNDEMWEANLLEPDGIRVIRQGLGRARRRPGRVRYVGGEAGARRHQPRHWPRKAQAWPPLARRCYLSFFKQLCFSVAT